MANARRLLTQLSSGFTSFLYTSWESESGNIYRMAREPRTRFRKIQKGRGVPEVLLVRQIEAIPGLDFPAFPHVVEFVYLTPAITIAKVPFSQVGKAGVFLECDNVSVNAPNYSSLFFITVQTARDLRSFMLACLSFLCHFGGINFNKNLGTCEPVTGNIVGLMAFSLKFYKYAGQILDFFWKTVSYQFIPKLVSYKTMFDRPVGLFPSFFVSGT